LNHMFCRMCTSRVEQEKW